MTTSTPEIEELRRQTAILIAERPSEIELNRDGEWVDDGAGGKKRSGGSQKTIPVTRYFGDAWPDSVQIVTQMGDRVVTNHVLIGMPGDDIREGDWFEINKKRYEVVFVHDDRSYQVKAQVRRYG